MDIWIYGYTDKSNINVNNRSIQLTPFSYSVKGTSTVSTLDSTSLLVGVNVGQGTSGSLDDFDAVAAGGIRVLATVGETLDHVSFQ